MEIFIGDRKSPAGKVVVAHGAHTNGGYDVANTCFEAGINMVVYIHIAYGDYVKLKKEAKGKLIVTGHIASDTVGINPFVAISQITPGPIAINSATYIGYKTAGFWGSACATIGVSLPSVIIMLIICRFFFKFKNNKYVESVFLGLRPAVAGLVASAAILVAYGDFIDYKSVIIFVAAFVASYKFKVDPILMTVIAGLAGFILY